MPNLSPYRKTIVVVLGLLAAFLDRRYGIGADWTDEVIALATALGVFGVPNAPLPAPAEEYLDGA